MTEEAAGCEATQAFTVGIGPISAGMQVQYEPCEEKNSGYRCKECGKRLCHLHVVIIEGGPETLHPHPIQGGGWYWERDTYEYCRDCSPDESHRDPRNWPILVKDPIKE